jgi:hypothetical protein
MWAINPISNPKFHLWSTLRMKVCFVKILGFINQCNLLQCEDIQSYINLLQLHYCFTSSSFLKIEVRSSSKTSVNLYQTTRCQSPEDNVLHCQRRNNLRSNINMKWRLKSEIVEPQQTYEYIAKQRLGKHIPSATNTQATIKVLPFLCNGEVNTPL